MGWQRYHLQRDMSRVGLTILLPLIIFLIPLHYMYSEPKLIAKHSFIHTKMCEKLYTDNEFSSKVVARTSMGRWGEPQDLRGLAVFLASPASDFITGESIYIDGGIMGR